jgi:hypothetical protein
MGPKSGQDALKHILGHANHSVTIWDKGEKTTGRRKGSCANQFRLHYNMMHHIMTSLPMFLLCRMCDAPYDDIPCNVFAMQIVWFRRSSHFQDFIGSIGRMSGYQQFHWCIKTPDSTISPCKFLLDCLSMNTFKKHVRDWGPNFMQTWSYNRDSF